MSTIPPITQNLYPASSKSGLSHNYLAEKALQNAKTGMNYSVDKEVSAKNAELVLSIFV
jgi:hypothetical protein